MDIVEEILLESGYEIGTYYDSGIMCRAEVKKKDIGKTYALASYWMHDKYHALGCWICLINIEKRIVTQLAVGFFGKSREDRGYIDIWGIKEEGEIAVVEYYFSRGHNNPTENHKEKIIFQSKGAAKWI